MRLEWGANKARPNRQSSTVGAYRNAPRRWFQGKKQEAAISGLTYKDAGVDIDAGNRLVEAIKPLAKATSRSGVMAGLGGFGGFFDPKAAGYTDPVLVAATDGVGTKLKVALHADVHDGVGIDLVAMCVNDLIVQGAEPLFFLDYFATGKLDLKTAEAVIAGIAKGCELAGCALIGGETAEMPDMYGAGEYDLAGFSVGAVERDQALTGAAIGAGDAVLGLASSGLHSNGFSLVRRVVKDSVLGDKLDLVLEEAVRDHLVERARMGYAQPAPFAPEMTLGEALLAPTRIYVKSLLAAIRAGGVHGMAHITGGGLLENIPRVLPETLAVDLDATSWETPTVFPWLAEAGGITPTEMARTFNCGIGMAVIVAAGAKDELTRILADHGETVFDIGRVIDKPDVGGQVVLNGAEKAWG